MVLMEGWFSFVRGVVVEVACLSYLRRFWYGVHIFSNII